MVRAGFFRKAKSFISDGFSKSIRIATHSPPFGWKTVLKRRVRLKGGKLLAGACMGSPVGVLVVNRLALISGNANEPGRFQLWISMLSMTRGMRGIFLWFVIWAICSTVDG